MPGADGGGDVINPVLDPGPFFFEDEGAGSEGESGLTVAFATLDLGAGPADITGPITVSAGSTLSGPGSLLAIGNDAQPVLLAVGGVAEVETTSLTSDSTLDVTGTYVNTGIAITQASMTLSDTSTLEVTDSGSLSDGGTVDLADTAASAVSATVATGGRWTVAGGVTVGDAGHATLTVSTATLDAAAGLPNGAIGLSLGQAATGTGTLDVTAGGRVDVAERADIGVAGTGLLSIDNGSATLGDGTTGVLVGVDAGGRGRLSVDGGGSLAIRGMAVVGGAGTGSLDVTGATASVSGNLILGEAGGRGHVHVGAGGRLAIAGALVSGGFGGGTGSVTVTDGGTITTDGSVALVGATLSADAGSAVLVGDGIAQAGQVVIGADGVVAGFGAIDGAVRNSGAIEVSRSGLTIAGSLSGGGPVTVSASRLDLQSDVAAEAVVTFDHAATLQIDAPGRFAGAIAGFDATDRIEVAGAASVTYDSAAHILSVFDASHARLGQIAVVGPDDAFAVTSTGTIALACFADGTHLATPDRPRAVEALRPGDRVRTADGRDRAVRWVGYRHMGRLPATHPHAPILVAANAFGPGLPARDLRLSPDHAVVWDGALVPVRCLVNGATVRAVAAHDLTYWHVELDGHDVLLADGLACESYLDTGNRGAFENADIVDLCPDFEARHRDGACRPIHTEGVVVAAAKRHLLNLARIAWTTDPAARIAGATYAWRDGWLTARLEPPGPWRLLSRSVVSAHADPDSFDPRRLGVAVAALRVDGTDIALDDPRLGSGWHAPEPGWRWTDGEAVVTIPGRLVELRLVDAVLRYPAAVGALSNTLERTRADR